MKIEAACMTHQGRKRTFNEDAVLMLREHEVFAAIDGLGGNAAGMTASQIVVNGLVEFFGAPEGHRSTFLVPLLAQAIQKANRRMRLASESRPELPGIGATIAAIQLAGKFVSIAHVGDCRVYRYSKSRLTSLTDDHSLVRDMLKMGKLTAEQAKDFPHRNVITRAIGNWDKVEVECQSVIPEDGDVFLLCSDGIHGMLDDAKIEALLGRELALNPDLSLTVQALVAAANAAGGNDNIAAILVRTNQD